MDLAPVVPTLVHLASADPKSFTEQARSRIAALPVGADETGAWVLTLQSLLTDDFGAFARAWEFGGTGFGADELLRIWTRHASSGLEVVCQEVVKGAVATSIPGRHLQLVAASHLVNSGDPVAAWSTVRALVDRAGEPLVPAAALAALIAELEPTLVPEWVAQLRDILERGRPTWAGPDHGAGAVAAGQLLELGELTLEQGVEQVLRAELDAVAAGQAASVTPIVTRILGRILEQRPDLRPRVAQGLEPLIAGDTRIPSAAGDIATDVRLTDLLRGLL